jgi:hypothetical protein
VEKGKEALDYGRIINSSICIWEKSGRSYAHEHGIEVPAREGCGAEVPRRRGEGTVGAEEVMSKLAELASALFPVADASQRYGKRLLTSVPAALEETYLAAMDPIETAKGIYNTAVDHVTRYSLIPGGLERLQNDIANEAKKRASSPEWWADTTVDAGMLLAAKKLPHLRDMTVDDYAVGAKFGSQQLANGYEAKPPKLGERAIKRWQEGFQPQLESAENDPRVKQIEQEGLRKYLLGF